MKRFFMAITLAATVVATPSPVAAAGTTCTYNAAEHRVTYAITGATTAAVYRVIGGAITLAGYYCGAATVTNTDLIVVTGDSQAQELNINFHLGLFKPGFTNEPGTSDEIEISVDLGGGDDTVVIVGNDSVNKFDFGQDNSKAGTPRKVNFNAGEGTGIDADMTMVNVEKLTVWTEGGSDVIRARGKAGTGPDPLTLPMLVHAGTGNDKVKGGDAQDRIYGEAGTDEIWGFGTGDFIHMDDGAPGDKGYGGAGVDLAYVDPGDTWQEN